jgi:hypothetical protein
MFGLDEPVSARPAGSLDRKNPSPEIAGIMERRDHPKLTGASIILTCKSVHGQGSDFYGPEVEEHERKRGAVPLPLFLTAFRSGRSRSLLSANPSHELSRTASLGAWSSGQVSRSGVTYCLSLTHCRKPTR